MLSLFLEMTEVGKESALASQANPESVRLFKRPRARAAPSYLRYEPVTRCHYASRMRSWSHQVKHMSNRELERLSTERG